MNNTPTNELRKQCEELLWDIALSGEDDEKSVDRLVALIHTTVAKETLKAEHYWIKYYGDQRKFLDGSDGDEAEIRELNRHQQLHKDRLAELEKLEGESHG